MSGNYHVIVAYAAGVGLLWGYALVMGLALLKHSRRSNEGGRS